MSDRSSTFRALLDSTKRNKDSRNDKNPSSLKEELAAIGHKTLASAVIALPELTKDRSIFFDLVQKDFREQQNLNSSCVPEEYCQQFSSLSSNLLHSIYRLVEVEQFFAGNPDLFNLIDEPIWPSIGDVVDGFLIEEELGRGAVSRVFRCKESDIGDRNVVLKVSTLSSQEAWLLGKLEHPNIMPIHSVGKSKTHPDLHWICMPFLGRVTLQTIIDISWEKGTPQTSESILANSVIDSELDCDFSELSIETYNDRILSIAKELSDALVYVHKEGVIHGDLKPSNVLLTPEGKPLLIDFNLASDAANSIAIIGGTLPYMAPEQLLEIGRAGQPGPTTVQAEIYSLAKLVLHALTGRSGAIEHSSSKIEDLSKVIREDRKFSIPKDLGSLAKTEPAAASLLRNCLADLPSDRPSSLRQFRDELAIINFARKREPDQEKSIRAKTRLIAIVASLGIILVTSLVLINRDYFIANRLIRIAEQNIQAGEISKAAHVYERLAAGNPDNATYCKKLAELSFRAKDYVPASEAYLKLASQHDELIYHAMAGYSLNLAKIHNDQAIYQYNLIEEKGFTSAAIRCNLAACLNDQLNEHYDEEKSKLVESLLLSALKMAPGNESIRFQMLRHYNTVSKIEAATLPSYPTQITTPLPKYEGIKFLRYAAIFLVQSNASQSDLSTVGIDCIHKLTSALGPNRTQSQLPKSVLKAYQALPGYGKIDLSANSKPSIEERSYYLDPQDYPLKNNF